MTKYGIGYEIIGDREVWYVADPTGHRVAERLESEAAAAEEATLREHEDEPTRVWLDNGTTIKIPLRIVGAFVGLDEYEDWLVLDECRVPVPLSPCCRVRATMIDGEVRCGSCRYPLPEYYDGPATIITPYVNIDYGIEDH